MSTTSDSDVINEIISICSVYRLSKRKSKTFVYLGMTYSNRPSFFCITF